MALDQQLDAALTESTASAEPSRATKRASMNSLDLPLTTQPQRYTHMLHRLSLAVLVVGLVVTGTLTATSRLNYLHNEQRLSNLQTSLTASALGVAPVDLERRLGQAAGAAGEASNPAATFRQVIQPSMVPKGSFTTATLALVRGGRVQVLAHVGAKSINNPTGKTATALFVRTAKSDSLVTTRVVGKGVQRLGYLMPFVGPGGTYVASAGQALPGSRRFTVPAKSPDSGLNIAIYFGRTTSSAALIETNVAHPPLRGTISTAIVPFGSNVLTLVVSPRGPLGGRWSELLPWEFL